MGFLDRLTSMLGLRKKECNVLVVGLDNSGKSTLLNHFKPEENQVLNKKSFNSFCNHLQSELDNLNFIIDNFRTQILCQRLGLMLKNSKVSCDVWSVYHVHVCQHLHFLVHQDQHTTAQYCTVEIQI